MIPDFAHLSAIGTELTTSTQILNYGLLTSDIFLDVFLGIVSARRIIQTHAALSIHALHFTVVFTLVQIFLMLTYVTLTATSN